MFGSKEDGAWLSLVERCVRDAEVAGSNPVAPTILRIPVHKVRESLAGATSEAFRELLGFFFAFKSFRKTLCQKKLSHEFSRDSFFYSTVTDFARLRG